MTKTPVLGMLAPGIDHMTHTIDELRAKVAVMRDLGIVECDGIKLGPAPSEAQANDETQRQPTPDEAAKAARVRRDHLMALSSGGPRPIGGTLKPR